MKIDLHAHTTASDGILPPGELVKLAISKGVKVLAISDHDTVDGIPQAIPHAAGEDIEIIAATELSIEYKPGTFHLVGLFIDWQNAGLKNKLSWLAERRSTRAERMVEDLAAHGVNISINEVLKEAGKGVIGKPHVARVLIRRGFAKDMGSVFKNFLEEGLPGYIPKDKINFEEAISLIKGAGGIGILAHPASLGIKDKDAFLSFLSELCAKGLAGLEAYSDMHTPEMTDFYIQAAQKLNLLVSGGSDYHGDKGEEIGCYDKVNPIPASLYGPIKEYMAINAKKTV
ncbi:MAG: PHP domain-containing protein [Leptospirales bacterium]|nr:PHP domain-containing protein [Leptospirales bacterium]